MPKLGNRSKMLQHNTGHFGFSAAQMDDLDSSRYTLVTIVVDRSGTTSDFERDMEQGLKEIIAACNDEHNPNRFNLLIRVLKFDDRLEEVHGFELVSKIDPAQYDGSLQARGGTALYDATIDGVESITEFGKQLIDEDYTVNGLLVVMTDGLENSSTLAVPGKGGLPDPKNVKASFQQTVKKECLESFLSILVGVNVADPSCKAALEAYKDDAGFTQFECLENADKGSLMKLMDFISRSISSQSSHLGTGGPSKPVTF